MNKKLLSFVGTSLLLVACGETSSGPVSYTLKVWGPNQEQTFLQARAEEFKTDHPEWDLTFEFAAVGEPDLKSVLTLDIAGGADVFAFPDDQLQSLVVAGALSPVQQYKTSVEERNFEWTVDLATVGDTLYAYPNTADNGVFMYYDKRFIDESEMTSLDTILAKAEELNTNIVIDPQGGWAMSMWFATNGNISWDGEVQTIDWNNEAGLASAKGMFNAYATNRVIRDAGLIPTLFLGNTDESAEEGIIAAVTGTWNATALTEILGENMGTIKMPTFTNGDGETVQLGSMIGSKLIGVNGFTTKPLVAHAFADYLTSFEVQKARALALGVGPSNLLAAEDEEVVAIPTIKAIQDQAPYGILQAKSVSSFYWTPAGAFADVVITEARAIDQLVEEALQEAIDGGTIGADDTEAQDAFRISEKATLIAEGHARLPDYLDTFIASVLAVNE